MTAIFNMLLNLKRRIFFKKLAHREYMAARGTLHSQLLKNAKKQISEKINAINNQITAIKKEWKSLYDYHQGLLIDTLHRHIVHTRLYEVTGIGPILQKNIESSVFRNRITDLYKASYLSGIGQTKQFYINQWIKKYEALIPEMLKSDFPGKAALVANGMPPILAKQKQIEELEQNKKSLEAKINNIDATLQELDRVTEKDIFEAYYYPELRKPIIDKYLQGVFAEWEPIPESFKKMVDEG